MKILKFNPLTPQLLSQTFRHTQNMTLYVPKGTKAKYEVTEGWKDFKNIVEIAMVDAVADETTVSTDNLSGQDLTDNVVDNVYYNLNGSDSGYDTTDGSIVIGGTTNMGAIENKEPGTSDVAQNFDGLILKVAKGSGTITVNAKTVGNAQLVVQVGNQTPMIASKNERGDVVVNYDVTEDTYVYIYAIIGSSNARSQTAAHRIAADNAVKIYSVKVAPGATGIASVNANDNVNANDRTYDLQGRRVEHPAKGIYIRNGRRVVVK